MTSSTNKKRSLLRRARTSSNATHARLALAALCVAALAVPSSALAVSKGTACKGADAQITAQRIVASERALLCVVNLYRVAHHAAVLTMDPVLELVARRHSQFMEENRRFEHAGIGDGTPVERIRAAGFPCSEECSGENLARNGTPNVTPRVLFGMWLASAAHLENLLNPYVTSGVGLAVGPNFGTTATQDFAYVSNGARDTAADLLTSGRCKAAKQRATVARVKVKRARKHGSSRLRRYEHHSTRAARVAKSACHVTYQG